MADTEEQKSAQKTLKEDRKALVSRLETIIETNRGILSSAAEGSKEAKEASKKSLKAAKERDALLKQDLTLASDLKKNFKDLTNTGLGGLEGMMGEMFGPLGGIATSLTTGFFRRSQENKKDLESNTMQVEATTEVAASLEGVSKATKEAGGEQEKGTDKITAALGGVADVSQTGYEDVELKLWTKMEDHLFFMRSNMESAEDRRERLRKGAGGMVASKGKGGGDSEEDGGFSFLELMGLGNLGKKAKIFIVGLRKMLGTGLFGKGGLFRNLKAFFIRTMRGAFGKGALKALGATLKIGSRLAGIAGVILMPIIDGILGYFNAEEWGVSKVSGVLGGVLAGGEGGILNMFMNAGKWAAIGATIGSVVPIVGTIAGGIIGAVLGGILGLIGGDVVAASFDKVGAWFVSVFDTVVDAISKVWHAVMPEWFTNIDFAWTDIFPVGLVKLFNGEYFTVDVPSFSWYSLFPNFLVEWFKGTAEKISDKPWSWTDIFPKFVVDFFTGAVAKDDYTFKWTDLFPTWLVKVLDSTAEAFDETPFTWYSLFPDWLVNLVKGFKVTGGAEAFHWTDIFPGWMQKIFKAGKEQGKTEDGGFDWTKLLPDWMAAAWDSTKALGGMAKSGLENLWVMIKEIFSGLIDKVMGLIGGETLQTMKDIYDDPLGAAGDAASAVGEGVSDAASGAWSWIKKTATGKARGGIVVNRPTYLPSSGTIVGEHGTWKGRGAARGGIPMDGGPEAIIPLTGNRAQGFIQPIAASIAGQVMNNLAMDRVGMGSAGASSAPTVIDSSSQQVITNNTIVNSPEPTGPMLPGAGRDTAVSHFRHVA